MVVSTATSLGRQSRASTVGQVGFCGQAQTGKQGNCSVAGAGLYEEAFESVLPHWTSIVRRVAHTSVLPAFAFEALPVAEPLSSPPRPRRRPPPLLPPPPVGSFDEGSGAERSPLSRDGAEEAAARVCGGPAVRMSIEEGGGPAAAEEVIDDSGSSSGSRYLPLKWEGHLSSTPRPLLPLPLRGGRESPAAPPIGGGERAPRTRR